MKEISGREALEILSRNGPDCMIASDTLGYFIQNNVSFVCYGDDASIVFIDQSTETDHITVVPLTHTFDSTELVNILKQGKANFDVWVDVQNLSEASLASFELAISGFLNYERTLEDLMYPAQTPMDGVREEVRLLNSEDGDLFAALSSESIVNRPPLPVLFDVFVTQKQGLILGAFEGEHIVGYLSFFPMLPGVFDVDYIYVSPSKRGQGIGKALGQEYARYALDRNHVAYWSNAQNNASKLTALSCGFQVIRQAKQYTGGYNGE